MKVNSINLILKPLSTSPLAFVFVFGLLASGCSRPTAVSSTMTEEEKDSLSANLKTLEQTLEEHSPFIFDKLSPPATDREIMDLRSELGGAQVDALEIWFRWHNGCTGYSTSFLPLGRMIPIAEALENRKMIQSIPFVESKRKSAIMLLSDGFGDGFFLDVEKPNPRVIYHMLETSDHIDYGTLQEFVAFIADVHSADIVTKNEEGIVDYDLTQYEEIEATYLKSIGSGISD